MKPNFRERLREAGKLASRSFGVLKKNWALNRHFFQWLPKGFEGFWLAFETLFPNLGRTGRFCWGVIVRYRHDDCLSYAAGLSFWLLISLVPLATLFFKFLEIFLGNQAFFIQTRDILLNVIPYIPESFLSDAANHTREVSNMGLAWFILLFGCYWGVSQFDKSLAHVFGVRIDKRLQTRKYHILRQMGLLVAGLFFLALILALLVGGGAARLLPATFQQVFLSNLSIVISLVSMTLIFQVVPRIRVAFRHAFLGALVSTFFWTIAKWGFRIYIDNALTWDIMYGSLLGIIAGLTFLYYTCAILLLGAEVTAAFYRKLPVKPIP